jgi:hypothetical protein
MHRRQVYFRVCRNTAQRGTVKALSGKELFGAVQDFLSGMGATHGISLPLEIAATAVYGS